MVRCFLTKARPAVLPKMRAGERVSDVIENAASVSGLMFHSSAVMDGGGAGIPS